MTATAIEARLRMLLVELARLAVERALLEARIAHAFGTTKGSN